MFLLDKLYRGELSPIGNCPKDNSAYAEAFYRLIKAQNTFLETLTPDTKEQYEALMELEHTVDRIAEEEMFVDGFRTGIKLLLDVIATD